jgi:NarL family two-component system response regulator LiaR
MGEIIRILIADDHHLLRQGLAAYIEHWPDFELAGEAANGKEAVDLCAHLHPDVVVMDLKMPELDGVTAARTIRRRFPRTKVIAFTSYLNPDLLATALDAGMIGYLLKTSGFKEVAEAIREAHIGRVMLAREAEQTLVRNLHTRNTFPLTGREREVLNLMTRGMTNAEIAAQLTVSLWTVKKHITNIFAKLKTTNRNEAIAIALKNNLVLDWYALS